MNEVRQQARGLMQYPGHGWRRLLFRMPMICWRLGLGRVIGRFYLLLTTTGRTSGKPRHTVLEYSVMDGKTYVSSGWGTRVQWYQNIVADPRVKVQAGGDLERAIATPVLDDEELTGLYWLLRGHSPVWKYWLESWDIRDDVADFVAKKDRLGTLRLDPTAEPTPSKLDADLIWVWPVILLCAVAWRLFQV